MTVIALCEDISKCAQLKKALSDLTGIKLYFLVTNNSKLSPSRFKLRLFRHWLGLSLSEKISTFSDRVCGRFQISTRELHHEENINWLKKQKPDVGLHATGAIYRRAVLDCFGKGILNPHIGILPEFRGRSVMEWSILTGKPTGISVFFMDEGIDTGPQIVLSRKVDISQFSTVQAAKAYLFSLDGEMYREALKVLQNPNYSPTIQRTEEGRRYYVMSGLLNEVVNTLLKSGK